MNVNEAVSAFIAACKRENTHIELSMDYRRCDNRRAVNVCVSSAIDGYLTAEDLRFYYDNFNKLWGGIYSDEYANIRSGNVRGWTPMYRCWYPLNKEVKLAARLVRMVNKYGYSDVVCAIIVADSSTVRAA